MAITSSTFGSVTLTGEDAKKFKRQITFGKPKAGAKESVRRGVELAREFRESGRELKIQPSPVKAR
jgi:hypothetical protein